MSAQQAQPAPARRSRKRRRRQQSYSSASESDSSSEDSDDDGEDEKPSAAMDVDGEQSSAASSSESESSSDSSSDSESESDSDSDLDGRPTPAAIAGPSKPVAHVRHRAPTLSPSPPPRDIPSFLAPRATGGNGDDAESERRARFKNVYMEKLVEGFGSDLEALRAADQTLGPARLQLLIDSLASGIDVFSDPQRGGAVPGTVDEVGVILNSS